MRKNRKETGGTTPDVDRQGHESKTRARVRKTLHEMEVGLDGLMSDMLEAGDDLRGEFSSGLRKLGKRLEAAAGRMEGTPT